MRNRILLPLSLFSPVLWANSLPSDVSITVFTTQHYPIQYHTLADRIYLLDAVENLEEQTTALFGNEPNLTIATEQAQKWLKSEAGKQFEQQLQQAYIGVTEGWKLGVMKVPAVVFQSPHHTSVIYGQTNIATAIATYQQSQE